uniref:Semaphorin-5A n=1 Tax=Hucho hucho TaxID=62062 RepID=A0A4W5JRJ1_9TELE
MTHRPRIRLSSLQFMVHLLLVHNMEPWIHRFRAEGTVDYSQLTFDPSQNELIVGARNHLFRLNLEDLSLIQVSLYHANVSCAVLSSPQEECQNYIRVLLVNGDRLFTCGTNAFTPICTNRTLTNLTEIHDQISGMARCPYNPLHNSTALITSSGELYAATAMDFSGRDPAIYRSLGGLPPLRTAQYNSKWLNEPNFVSSYDIGNFTYFFFRENAVEHDCGRTVFSRAARVCKNDIGGRFLLEDTWTTFMKARLNCSRPGEIPFNYNELQGTFYLPELELLYGIFTTNVNSIAASAVCAFNLSAITQVFGGPFKYQENSRSAWLPYPNPNPDFQCGTIDYGSYVNLTERNLQDAQKFLLMNEVVQPVQPVPYFMEDNIRFSHVAVDVVQGKDMLFHIIYLATDYGTIRKVLSPLNQSMGSCLLDEIELFPPRRRQPIRSLLILHSSSELYVGVRDQVVKIPLMRCNFHKTREACVGARDPYCGWDLVLRKCTTLEESVSMSQWEQSITKCPVRNVTVDGGFGPWSGWGACSNTDGGSAGSCLCRTRACDNPTPQCGGQSCHGLNVEVANCSRNGAWTPWTLWAPCSTSCGIGFQVRQRSCSNPTPRHGGRVCVGQNREERYCNEHLPCPPHVYWSAWSAWERCTVPCGGGIQSRRRTCENGNECPGCAQEYQECNVTPCPDEVKGFCSQSLLRGLFLGSWTNPEHHNEVLSFPDMSSRHYSSRTKQEQHNEILLDGSWSCWSGWSKCSVTCGGGHYMRTRTCNNPPPAYGGDICLGLHTEEALCNTQSCPESWSNWSEWSQCDSAGSQLRVRHCDILFPTGNQCSGNHTETRACPPDSNFIPEVSIARSSQEERRCGDFNLFHMVAVGLSSSIMGCLVTLLVYTYCQRYQQQSHDATVIHPISAAPLNTSITNHINKLDKYDSVEAIKAFNKNNLILEERNKYFNPQLAGKTYTNAYFTDLNTYDDY